MFHWRGRWPLNENGLARSMLPFEAVEATLRRLQLDTLTRWFWISECHLAVSTDYLEAAITELHHLIMCGGGRVHIGGMLRGVDLRSWMFHWRGRWPLNGNGLAHSMLPFEAVEATLRRLQLDTLTRWFWISECHLAVSTDYLEAAITELRHLITCGGGRVHKCTLMRCSTSPASINCKLYG